MSIMLWILLSCDNPSSGVSPEVYNGNSKYTIREKTLSVDGSHEISTFVTNNSGIGVIVDGDFKYYDDYAIRYRPVISENGQYAWAQQLKGSGYDIIWQNKSILHSGACLDFLTASNTKAICSESDTGLFLTRLYLIDMETGDCKCIALLKNEYIEDICRYDLDKFSVITCLFDSDGNKLYNLYSINGKTSDFIKIEESIEKLVAFPKQKYPNKDLLVDYIQISDNERYLYNALKLLIWGGKVCDAFAFGNDFRGRVSWDESQRLRGLCELYKKTGNEKIEETIKDVVNGILNARNLFTGIITDDWNPEFLWSSKCYTINDNPACLLIESGEILSSLLYACNEGIINNKEIIFTAEKSFDYYDQWYKNGHYYLPYGIPANFDGIVVPWNYQNSFAEVCLGLYLETREQKYLDRCNALLAAFKNEWVEESDRIYWHYWPMEYYNGWNDDGRSKNTPSSNPITDNLFEDISHAGISVRLISRYIEHIPNGVVNESHLNKIESNMKYFCFNDGFGRFISGDLSYSPKAWHYWISPYFAYLHNIEFEKYVRQGYLKCFPQWDSQESLFANAKLYKNETSDGFIRIEKKQIDDNDMMVTKEIIQLSTNDLFKYVNIQ